MPAIVSKEIAVNLDDGGGRMFEGELAIVEKARIDTWGKILKEYIKEIYGFRGEL